jgi:hypothetical protein
MSLRPESVDARIWAALRDHFESLSDLQPDQRPERLRQIRETDPEMADLLDDLIKGETAGFLSRPLWDVASPPSIPIYALETGALLHDRFEVREFLGCGGSGEVYAVFDSFRQQMVALKLIRRALFPGSSGSSLLRNELNVASLVGLSHGLRQTVKTLLTVRCKFIVPDPGTVLG